MVGWEATAAYFYVLRLDRSALAWEYLRRNPSYRQHWLTRKTTSESAARWGCATLENPDLDARYAWPGWLPESPDLVTVTRVQCSGTAGDRFSVWGVGGQRRLSHAGSYLQLQACHGSSCLQIRVDPLLNDGDPYAFVVRADGLLRERMRIASEFSEQLKCSRTSPKLGERKAVNRAAWTHARALQALDGVQEEASHRDIGTAMFGAIRVNKDWSTDGELRAQVRYLIRRGQALMNGGYRSLLLPGNTDARGEM